MLARNWLPRPSPREAPRTSPAMSTKASRVGHCDLAEVRLDGAERIILRLRGRGLGQRVEQGGLADVRQPDDPAAESHVRAVRRPHPPARRDAWARRTPSPPSPG